MTNWGNETLLLIKSVVVVNQRVTVAYNLIESFQPTIKAFFCKTDKYSHIFLICNWCNLLGNRWASIFTKLKVSLTSTFSLLKVVNFIDSVWEVCFFYMKKIGNIKSKDSLGLGFLSKLLSHWMEELSSYIQALEQPTICNNKSNVKYI